MRLLPVIITCGVENVNEDDLESVKQKTSNCLFMELFGISAFCVLSLALLGLIGVSGIISGPVSGFGHSIPCSL